MDAAFKVLLQKDIFEFLEGNGDDLITYDGVSYGLPYYTGTELCSICRSFGVTELLGGSRWTYVEALLRFAIEKNRCDELFRYLFSLERFKDLRDLQDINVIEKLHTKIVVAAIKEINRIVRLTRKEMQLINGHFFIVDIGTNPIIQTPKVDVMTTAYVRGLRERCEADLVAGNLDSVITKSRTMIEEVLIQILEQNNVVPSKLGKIGDLYNQVKNLRGMQQKNEFDKRINGLLSGLEKIVQNIGDMRNINSDAHGVGSNRIVIKEKEAMLVMNSTITFCEYLL